MRITIFPRFVILTRGAGPGLLLVIVVREVIAWSGTRETKRQKMWLAANDEWYYDTTSVQKADDRRMNGQQQK
jgi:hypothetical protein